MDELVGALGPDEVSPSSERTAAQKALATNEVIEFSSLLLICVKDLFQHHDFNFSNNLVSTARRRPQPIVDKRNDKSDQRNFIQLGQFQCYDFMHASYMHWGTRTGG